ncbi:baseplate wedge subunit [Synechococcus phage BUCT-ZZ01]|nr:baseplate wedge subunit [Synechococcus phage BUCT-ZZ01]
MSDFSKLDFDGIKKNLVDYLKTKPEFTDYNFEGSALSVILDLLAYNTHYQGVYTNFLHNETFLDSAVKRSSVVSRAKELGYVPRSAAASTAYLDVVMNNVPLGTPVFSVNRGTVFKSSIDNVEYQFIVTNNQSVTFENGLYVFKGLEVKEGKLLSNNFVVTEENKTKYFRIPNKNVDTKTLKVFVASDNLGLDFEEYQLGNGNLEFTSQSQIFFLQESFDGFYEVYFGDDAIGKGLTAGNIVVVEYLVTNKEAADGCRTFTLAQPINGYTNVSVTAQKPSSGGKEQESVDSIKFYAPKAYTQQNRVVTPQDYVTYINNNLPNIDSVSVWGGEDNDPPIYGKVFIAVKPAEGFTFSDSAKEAFARQIEREQGVVTVIPEFVDPRFNFITQDLVIKYRREKSAFAPDQLREIIAGRVKDYFKDNVENFRQTLYFSKLLRFIDESEPNILSSLGTIYLNARNSAPLFQSKQYEANFSNAIKRRSVFSTSFFINLAGVDYQVKIRDNPNVSYTRENLLKGITETFSPIEIYSVTDVNKSLAVVGEVNYNTGKITFATIVTALPELQEDLIIYAEPLLYDIVPTRETIFLLDDNLGNTSSDRLAGLSIQIIEV